MAWIYLAESVDSLRHWRPGSNQSPTVSKIHTAKAFFCPECKTVRLTVGQYGTTCEHWRDAISLTLQSTLSMADSHARTLVLREMDRAWRESVVDWYSRYLGLSVKPNLRSSFWKMSRQLGPVEENEWSKNWPRSGMTVDGIVYPLTTWERRTSGIAGGYWPTATATDAKGSRNATVKNRKVKGHSGTTLTDFVTLWPTPTTRDRIRSEKFRVGRALSPREMTGGSLSPMWVEWLMGYPIGWTALKDWATLWFRPKREKRSRGSSASHNKGVAA